MSVSSLKREEGIELSGWRDKAACRDMDPDLFFPTTSSEERLALKACAQCPAICECARYAAQHDRIRRRGLMLSKAKSKAWQLLIEDSNRPAEEIRLATGLRVDVIEQMRGDVQKRLRDNPEF